MFETVPLGLAGQVGGDLEVHAGSMRLVGRHQRLVFAPQLALLVEVYHAN